VNVDAEEMLRRRLGALRVDPPAGDFEERLRERLRREAPHTDGTEVIRPRRFRMYGGRVGLLAVAAVCFAGGAAALVGSGQRFAIWTSDPAPSVAPVVAQTPAVDAPRAKPNPARPAAARLEPPVTEAARVEPARVEPVRVEATPAGPPPIPRLSLSARTNPRDGANSAVPRVTIPTEQIAQREPARTPSPIHIPRLQAHVEAPELGQTRGNSLLMRQNRDRRGPSVGRPEVPREGAARRLEDRFERRGASDNGWQRPNALPAERSMTEQRGGRGRMQRSRRD